MVKGEKNFCFSFQISSSSRRWVGTKRWTLVLRLHPLAVSLAIEPTPVRSASSRRSNTHKRRIFMCVGFQRGGKKASSSRRCLIFSHSQTNMSAFLFKYPGEAASKCQAVRMRAAEGASASLWTFQGRVEATCCSAHSFTSFIYHRLPVSSFSIMTTVYNNNNDSNNNDDDHIYYFWGCCLLLCLLYSALPYYILLITLFYCAFIIFISCIDCCVLLCIANVKVFCVIFGCCTENFSFRDR